MNKDNQTTISELQSIIDGLREMEQQNQQVVLRQPSILLV